MKYKCDIKFMAVPSRMCNVVKLCNQLGLSFADVAVDTELTGLPLMTSQRAFSMPYDEGVTHRLVLQDDLLINSYLKELLQVLVNRFPNNPIALYTYKNERIVEEGVYKLHFLPGPSIIMPRMIMQQIQMTYKHYPAFPHDDWFYSWFCHRNGIKMIGIIPNLVTLDMTCESSLNHKVLKVYTDIGYSEAKVNINELPDRTGVYGDWYINLSDREFEKILNNEKN